jgi:hypothetical protein
MWMMKLDEYREEPLRSALSRGSQAATKLGSGEQESVSLCAADQLLDREDLRRRVAFPRFTTLG